MGKLYDSLDGVRDFLLGQHVFFVATAPLSASGHVNLSPKGLDSFRILGQREVAYLDYPGSGVETIAHLGDNGRIALMFCAFDGSPKIVRLWGKGRAVEPGDPGFADSIRHFKPEALVRAVIHIEVERIADSCGYGVPRYEYVGDRQQLQLWSERKGEEGLRVYQRQKNVRSIDGLPGLPSLQSTSSASRSGSGGNGADGSV
jgi:pyridoxamine 5'-phosphate oxidase-like protein